MASHGLRALPQTGDDGAGLTPRVREEEERKRSFLRMVSHELRTPLNSILGFSEIIACELYGPINDKRYRDHAQLVRESGLKLLALVNQVMEIARLETGAADLDIRPEALRPAVEDAVASLYKEAAPREIEFHIEAGDALPAVLADSRALKTILVNLLQNAVTFSPEGGEVTINLIPHPTSVSIEIRDQGEGADPAELARLMRPFEQGEAALTRRAEGAGLGLPIVRLLCRSMDGALRLHSAPGEGFTAVVRLPRAPHGAADDDTGA